jgi:hypothetical protein
VLILRYRLGTWLLLLAAARMDHPWTGPHDRLGAWLWGLGCALRER